MFLKAIGISKLLLEETFWQVLGIVLPGCCSALFELTDWTLDFARGVYGNSDHPLVFPVKQVTLC